MRRFRAHLLTLEKWAVGRHRVARASIACMSLVIGSLAIAALFPPLPAAATTPPSVTISPVAAAFYPNPNNSGSFDTSQLVIADFTQTFPVIDFNPPSSAQVACSNNTNVTENTRPFTDVIPNPDGTCSTQVATGNGFEAGTGDRTTFEAVFQTNLTVDSAAQVTFNFFSDDGWILGLGKQQGGTAQPTYVSGELSNAPASSPVQGYPVVGALNGPSAPTEAQVTVNFPTAGTYPMEVDYTECCGGQLSLTLGTTAGNPIPSGGPSISKVNPDYAPFTGGTTVTITGSNFGTSPSVVFTDDCNLSEFFAQAATIISSSPTQIVVSVPSAEGPATPNGLLNVASMNGPACLEVFAASGSAATSFTYVVPEIGLLMAHSTSDGKYHQCTAEAVQSNNQRVVLTAGHCVAGMDDFAFAPGYFGPFCGSGCSPALGSSSAFLSGTAPYGVWCAKSSAASDPGCGNSSGTSKVMPNFGTNPNTEDFAYIVTTPKNGATLGQKIGGGLAITFSFGIHSDQTWNIFGYNGDYLDTCLAPTTFDFGNAAAAVLQIANGGVSACNFVVSGASGGAWINGQNGAFDGIGAVNDTAPTPNPQGVGTGAYMGPDAKALWNSVQNLP